MRLFITGQGRFGQEVLKLGRRLGHEIAGVSAPPERASGGWDRLRAEADVHRIPWMPAGTLRAETLPRGVDLILAAHSHEFVGRATRLRARREVRSGLAEIGEAIARGGLAHLSAQQAADLNDLAHLAYGVQP